MPYFHNPKTAATLLPPFLLGLYVTSLTFFARQEAAASTRRRLLIGTIGLCAAVTGLLFLDRVVPAVHREYISLVVLLGLLLGYRGLVTTFRCHDGDVERAVRTFVLSIIAFDTCIVWAGCGLGAAMGVSALIIPAIILRRWFRVT